MSGKTPEPFLYLQDRSPLEVPKFLEHPLGGRSERFNFLHLEL